MKKSHIRKKKLARLLDQVYLEIDSLPSLTVDQACERIRKICISPVSGKSRVVLSLILSRYNYE